MIDKLYVGYQGIQGSFSEQAAKNFFENENYNVEFVPLISSGNVVKSLKENKTNYGVLAIRNSTAGKVKETLDALKNIEYIEIKRLILPIHHCVYIRQDKKIEDIRVIASHEQAINQTKKTRQKILKDIKTMEVEDTALAAKNLSLGILEPSTAVICSKNAGEIFNLKLLYENIEDNSDNATTFILISKK